MTSDSSLLSLPAHLAQPFALGREVLPVGAVREHRKEVGLDALLVGGGVMTPRSLEMASRSEVRWRERIVEVDTHGFPRVVEAVFLSSRGNDPFEAGSVLLPDGLSGRRFRVSLLESDGNGSLVESLDGDGLDDGLRRIVQRDVRGLGEAPLFWSFCPAGEVLPNTPMPLGHTSASAWFGHDPSFVVEHASATFVGMADLQDTVPGRVALFLGAVSFRGSQGQAGPAVTLQAALSGWIGVDPATGERVAAELSGPVQLEVTAQALGLRHPMSGQGTLSISTRSRLLVEMGAS